MAGFYEAGRNGRASSYFVSCKLLKELKSQNEEVFGNAAQKTDDQIKKIKDIDNGEGSMNFRVENEVGREELRAELQDVVPNEELQAKVQS